MQIHHGGFQLRMAEVLLDHPEVDPGFQQMGGIRMPERMDRDITFLDAGLTLGLTEGALEARPREGPARRAEDAALALGMGVSA